MNILKFMKKNKCVSEVLDYLLNNLHQEMYFPFFNLQTGLYFLLLLSLGSATASKLMQILGNYVKHPS